MHVARQGLIVMRLSSLGIELDAAKVKSGRLTPVTR
jgi:hypothetical protein